MSGKITLTKRQWEVLELLQANYRDSWYLRGIGVMQDAGLRCGSEHVKRGSVTAEALERKGLITIDRRDWRATAYRVFVSTRARDLLTARGAA